MRRKPEQIRKRSRLGRRTRVNSRKKELRHANSAVKKRKSGVKVGEIGVKS